MDSLFRYGAGGRLRAGNLVKQIDSGVSQLIANEFFNMTLNPFKRISVTLKNAAGVALANVPVKYVVFEFAEGIPYNNNYMTITGKGVFTTDATGLFEIIYTGSALIGGQAYLGIIQPHNSPSESALWTVTIV